MIITRQKVKLRFFKFPQTFMAVVPVSDASRHIMLLSKTEITEGNGIPTVLLRHKSHSCHAKMFTSFMVNVVESFPR